MRFRYEEHEVKEWQKYFFKLWHATHPAPCATDMYCMYMYIVTLKKKGTRLISTDQNVLENKYT